ncbi:hypothetical protein AOQ71_31855 [Bradyrhizobium manausense]|uniref:Uncharacterized protein n=1 Tax=Bradyrhizobium manausense TaxID=989370 RepID=A0A0R3D0I8_9BRAD|nr:hypothetical protein [Bradyrhizobium manausense]KRQ03320.1 hypothetical protein AOQ71_31855 [Bradyrhizobium manausense]
MPRPTGRITPALPDGRPVKITLGQMRETGARGVIVFCEDYRCSHNVKLAPDVVDQWPDELRISDLEPRFVCGVCGRRGAIVRSDDPPPRMGTG